MTSSSVPFDLQDLSNLDGDINIVGGECIPGCFGWSFSIIRYEDHYQVFKELLQGMVTYV
jgi:hypothetical protein